MSEKNPDEVGGEVGAMPSASLQARASGLRPQPPAASSQSRIPIAALLELAERCESGGWHAYGQVEARHRADLLCRELHEIDPHSNVNGTCADYAGDLYQARRLIPKGMLFSICHDVNEVRAVVATILTECCGGFSAIPHGPYAETRALCAAALRARAAQ